MKDIQMKINPLTEPIASDSVKCIWRHVFMLLASLELGRAQTWSGPDDFEELKIRVETLSMLMALVPRNELGRIEEVVNFLAATYSPHDRPELNTVRSGVRQLLMGQVEPLSHQDQDYIRAAEAIAGKRGRAVPQVAAPVELGDNGQKSFELCCYGLGTWFKEIRDHRKWKRIRLFASDEIDISIDDVFVEVFTVPDTDVETGTDDGTARVRRVTGRITGETHAVIDAVTMIARTSNFCIVVGDPGSGKTTLVKWIARSVMNREIPDFETSLVVNLGPFALALVKSPKLTLLEFFFSTLELVGVDDWSEAANYLRKVAQEGAQYLLLLDGWDEVPAQQRDKVEERIDHERPYFTTIITSRPTGFPRRFATGGRAEVYQISGLTQDGRRTLALRYLQAIKREMCLEDLLKQVESNRDLKELACNPFMMGLLTWAIASDRVTRSHELTLAELYQLATTWIIDIPGEGRTLEEQIRLVRSLDGLKRISYGLLFDDLTPRYVFSVDKLYGEFDLDHYKAVVGSRFVSRIDSLGNFFAFMHATFQEYFAARHAESLGDGELDKLLQRAFLSASRSIVLEFVIGLDSRAGRSCLAHLNRWMKNRDKYGQVVYRIARLLAACPPKKRPQALVRSIYSDLWNRITGKQDFATQENGVALFARLDPVALCKAAWTKPEPDQFVLDCILTAVPVEVARSERIAELLDPALRERVEGELLGGRSPAEVEANHRILMDPTTDEDQLREAILFAGASRALAVVPALKNLLRVPTLSDALKDEISTSLGLIGGKEASQSLVDLVTGDIPGSPVAVGLARRSLQHIGGGRKRLDPAGRDKLLRRIACTSIDQLEGSPMLSALQGFPIRTGTRLLKYLAFAAGLSTNVRFEFFQLLVSLLPDTELDILLQQIQGESVDTEALLLATAVQRRRPIPVCWLKYRLQIASRLPDKTMLLTVALVMSTQPENSSSDVDKVLEETMRSALSSEALRHSDLAGAFQQAVADLPVNFERPLAWIDSDLCQELLRKFMNHESVASTDQVMLAATLLGRVPSPKSSEVLHQSLGECRNRLNQLGIVMQQDKLLNEVARAISKSLAGLDPESLLEFVDWKPVDEVLQEMSFNRGWFVFHDRILDSEGQPVQVSWKAKDSKFDIIDEETKMTNHGDTFFVDTVRSHMNKKSTHEELHSKISKLKEMLVLRATGGTPSPDEYEGLRRELVMIQPIRELLPECVVSSYTIQDFWNFIKPKLPTYQERQEFLRNEFAPILSSLEQGQPLLDSHQMRSQSISGREAPLMPTEQEAKKVVLELDLVGYSEIASILEENSNSKAVLSLNQQIQSLIDLGLKSAGVTRFESVIKTTGDGAILMFDQAMAAHIFARKVHAETQIHNQKKTEPSALRLFRMGAATGEITLQPLVDGGYDIAGVTITRAVRLEAAAKPGELLVDLATFGELPPEVQSQYQPEEHVAGKRNERFQARRCVMNPDATLAPALKPTVETKVLQPSKALRQEIRELMNRIKLDSQLYDVIFLLGLPIDYQPSKDLNLAKRKQEVLHYMEVQPNGLTDLVDVLREVIKKDLS